MEDVVCPRYLGPNTGNMHIVADLYAEVVGVVAQSRYCPVNFEILCSVLFTRNTSVSALLLVCVWFFFPSHDYCTANPRSRARACPHMHIPFSTHPHPPSPILRMPF